MTVQIEGGFVPLTEGLRLELARRGAGYTQKEFAKLIEIANSSLQRYESGIARPKRPVLAAWSMATGVTMHWLETGEAPADDPDGGLSVRHQGLEPRTRCLNVLAGLQRTA